MRLDDLVFGMERALADIDAGLLAADLRPFAGCSLTFCGQIIARLEDGRFEDPLWIRALAIDADQRYLKALRDPAARPGPWRVAFDVAAKGSGKRMRNVLLGINAHILYDLVVTLAHYIDPAKVVAQRADFQRLNDIILTAVDVVQDGIERDSRFLEIGDALTARTDEVMTWGIFKYARGLAFDHAEQLRKGTLDLATVERNATAAATALALFPF